MINVKNCIGKRVLIFNSDSGRTEESQIVEISPSGKYILLKFPFRNPVFEWTSVVYFEDGKIFMSDEHLRILGISKEEAERVDPKLKILEILEEN